MTNSTTGMVPEHFGTFRFDSFDFDRQSGQARFRYHLVGGETLEFSELVTFTLPDDQERIDWERVDAALPLLGAILGLSYYKAAAPARYEIGRVGLTQMAIDYLGVALADGLGEFAYRNDLPGLLRPEIVPLHGVREAWTPVALPEVLLTRPLVPIGGGKDSVVSVESLAKAGLRPTQFAVRPNSIIRRVAEVSGLPFVEVGRVIDPLLIRLNSSGALNGHVPVTAMNSLIAIVQSLLLGLGPVVMSNESSASDPTLSWNGIPINHQWSKSFEAELLLSRTLAVQLGYDGLYFSLLRSLSELRIAKYFSHITRYDQVIVSCNRAYRMGVDDASWCGDCDKCRFIFLAFAPFMSRERLIGIFGKNLFDDESQFEGYGALLGLGAHKPFDCVGEEAESTVAMSRALRMDDWRDTVIVRRIAQEVPELAVGNDDLEATVFALGPTQELPTGDYRKALHAYE